MADTTLAREAPRPSGPDTPQIDLDEIRRMRRRRAERIGAWALPVVVVALTIGAWEMVVRVNEIPHYILPGPGRVAATLAEDWPILFDALLVTLKVTGLALATAIVAGVGLAILFSLSKWIEMSLFPYAVILQVTPVVAIAPLILIYIDSKIVALVVCAWIVAFFPVLSNTTLGLNSADHNLRDLFRIYGATKWQTLRHLQIPAAMPYFLAGLKIAGGLSLIGAIVAEYVAGTAGTGAGLAFRILEAGYRLNIPRMFAALLLIALTGVLIFAVTSLIQHLMLRKWHESAVRRER
ncbi:MAG: ABC transporter permease [Pseudomonadota bacterium]